MARKHFGFEHKNSPILSKADFFKRQLKFLGYAFFLLAFSLGLGMTGYRIATGMGWVDAFYNASMILTGMGPVDTMPTQGAKIFGGSYALFSGIVFLTTVAVMFAPLIHRLLHLMHIEETDAGD